MKFYTMVKSVEASDFVPPQALMDGISQLGEEAAKAGVFVDMGGFMPTAAGAEVRVKKGKVTVTDGPFAEGREVVGGWAVYNTKTKAEAMAWVQKFVDLHLKHVPQFDFVVEVRQVMDFTPG